MTTRAAVYARFSSDLQRETSIEDQLAVAHKYAAAREWNIEPQHVYTDAAIGGASLDRPGVQALLTAAARQPRLFDVLLVDDSSRVSRDLADAVRFLQQLKFFGVRVIYVSQGIDSDNEQAETLAAVHGIVDSMYLQGLAAKTKRGLAGQLTRGYATGAATYGYRSIPVPDPSGKRDGRGQPAMLGMRIEIEPTEAQTIVRIFQWFGEGLGVGRIVDRLNRERVSGPRGAASWKYGAVRRILSNERYTGRQIWGQRRHERQPGTKRRVARMLPREQWHVQDRPDLRIVDAVLWEAVQRRQATVRETLGLSEGGRSLMRGRNAVLHSRHLFSGFMKCAECGGSVVVMHGGSGSPRYGCSKSWRHGKATCANRVTIRAALADERLLAGLTSELLKPVTVRYIADALAAQLNRRINDRPRLEAAARAAHEQTTQRIRRLVKAIEDGAPAAALTAAIREREAELRDLDRQLAELAEPVDEGRLAVMPSWVRGQLTDLATLLASTPERAKAKFQQLGLAVTLQPVRTKKSRAFYRASCSAHHPLLSGTRDLSGPAADASCPRSDASRMLEFRVDLPANLPIGPAWRKRAG